LETWREYTSWKYLGTGSRIIFRWIRKKCDEGAWSKFVCFGMCYGGGLLWTRWWTFGFRKVRGIGSLAEELLASQEALCSVEFFLWSSAHRIIFWFYQMHSVLRHTPAHFEISKIWMGLTFGCIQYLKYIILSRKGSQDSLYVQEASYRTVKAKIG
jgi:hypothetical protein